MGGRDHSCERCGRGGFNDPDGVCECPPDVYEELRRVQRKCFQLRKQIKAMHVAFDKGEIAALRAERDGYRTALSNIAYRLDQGEELDPDRLRLQVRIALECNKLRGKKRVLAVRRLRREAGVTERQP